MAFEEIDVKTLKLENFVFIVYFSSYMSHRKNRTVKGGLGETYITFPK